MAGRSLFSGVDLQVKTNNSEHRTIEASKDRLIVRRGQAFTISLSLTQAFDPKLHGVTLTAKTGGQHVTESFSFPDNVKRPPLVKTWWKVEPTDSGPTKEVTLVVTSAADAVVGEYELFGKLLNEEKLLGKLVMLFNPWCREDTVFLSDEAQRQEYVLNEHGVIFKGSANYIFPLEWDYGQFEENMVDICLKLLDRSLNYYNNPAKDARSLSDPIHVGRMIAAMINSLDDNGVMAGRWSDLYTDGKKPTHWTGSYAILDKWFQEGQPVKYGQCWVFAGVMCSVMRLMGIPSRVITNFTSAHDDDMNLIIDTYYDSDGVKREEDNRDSIRNFHVWTEGLMKRPDLGENGDHDGWQVLDPTPQEKTTGVFRCGPASVKAVLEGHTDFKYDVPFVFAAVNADCIDWTVTDDGKKTPISSDTKRVGKYISTKRVGSRQREDITNTYKHPEGTDKERRVFVFATTRDYSSSEKMNEEEEEEDADVVTTGGAGSGGMDEGATSEPLPPVTIRFKEVSRLINGKDVNLKLVLQSQSSDPRPLSIHISVQAMKYNGVPAGKILTEDKEETLLPGKVLSIPIVIPFLAYHKFMVESESMKVTAVITDKGDGENRYLAMHNVVLMDPPISITAPAQVRLNEVTYGEVTFTNPINKTLTNCTMTFSGAGLFKKDLDFEIPDVLPNKSAHVKYHFTPYKKGVKTVIADFDCDSFRDIKGTCTVNVTE